MCPECALLLHQATGEEEVIQALGPLESLEPYLEHLEPIEDDSCLFRDLYGSCTITPGASYLRVNCCCT